MLLHNPKGPFAQIAYTLNLKYDHCMTGDAKFFGFIAFQGFGCAWLRGLTGREFAELD